MQRCVVYFDGKEIHMNILIIFICFMNLNILKSTAQEFHSFCNALPFEEINDTVTGKGNIILSHFSIPRSWLIHLNTEKIFGIDLALKDFDLRDHFLVIRDATVPSPTVEQQQSEILFISGKSSEALYFKIPMTKSFYMEICPEEHRNNLDHSGTFTIMFERAEPDFEDNPLPGNPEDAIIASYEIQFRGKPADYFINETCAEEFKEVVKRIAISYCIEKNIHFIENKPGNEMVLIHAVHMCPTEWPDWEICASVLHSVHVSGNVELRARSIWDYELTVDHLREMWEIGNVTYLEELELSLYNISIKKLLVAPWLLLLLPGIVLIAIYFLRPIFRNKYPKENLKNSHIATEQTNERKKKYALKPNKHQIIPMFLLEEKENWDRKTQNVQIRVEEVPYCAALFLFLTKSENTERNQNS